jgi:hypothetical protein
MSEKDEILSKEDFESMIIESFLDNKLKNEIKNPSNINQDVSDWQPVYYTLFWTGSLFKD